MDARSVFEDRSLFVKLRPEGFEFHGRVTDRLEVCVRERPQPVRKLFEGGRLTCYAPDGHRSRSGRDCDGCRDRWRCQPRLQLRGTTDVDRPFILELPPRASVRFLDLWDGLQASGGVLAESRIRMRARQVEGALEIDADVAG